MRGRIGLALFFICCSPVLNAQSLKSAIQDCNQHLGVKGSDYEVVAADELASRWAEYRPPDESLVHRYPMLIGFERDHGGKIQPITTLNSHQIPFASVREGVSDLDWIVDRSIKVLSLDLNSSGHRIFLTQAGQVLDQLDTGIELFRQQTFVVSNGDEVRGLRFPKWSALMSTAEYNRGRTAVLLRFGQPVVLRDRTTGAEWILEIKGVGSPSGGIFVHDHIGYLGGATASEARREIENLQKASADLIDSRGVLPAGFLLFDKQGNSSEFIQISEADLPSLIFRWAPSSVRGTFVNSGEILNRQEALDLSRAMGYELGLLARRGLLAFTHPENWVKSAPRAYSITDFSDTFRVEELPVFEGTRMRSASDFRQSIDSRKQIPGYSLFASDIDRAFFSNYSKGFSPDQVTIQNTEQAIKAIFEKHNGQMFLRLNSFEISKILKNYRSENRALLAKAKKFYDEGLFRQPWFDRDDRPTGLGEVVDNLRRANRLTPLEMDLITQIEKIFLLPSVDWKDKFQMMRDQAASRQLLKGSLWAQVTSPFQFSWRILFAAQLDTLENSVKYFSPPQQQQLRRQAEPIRQALDQSFSDPLTFLLNVEAE